MTLHFINAQLVDPEAGKVTRGSLIVRNGVIDSLSADSIPAQDARVVDCGVGSSRRASSISA